MTTKRFRRAHRRRAVLATSHDGIIPIVLEKVVPNNQDEMEEDSSPRQPDEVLTEEEESTSPRERMLTEEEVLKIFEHVHDSDRSLPPCLQYQVIPVDPNASKITPPPFNFKDGIFLLCVTDTPNFPQHLKERVSREPLKKSNFHWHPAKKDAAERLQMRNCYRYRNGNVGGPPAYLWTKVSPNNYDLLRLFFPIAKLQYHSRSLEMTVRRTYSTVSCMYVHP